MKRAVLSLSGGMDSTCLLIHLLANNYEVKCYSFNYGQKHIIELDRVKQNIEYLRFKGYDIPWQVIDLKSAFSESGSALVSSQVNVPEGHYADENMKATAVENRNAIFSSIIYGKALAWANEVNDDVSISLGIHSGDHCFSKDTQILTPTGLRDVSNLKRGDIVFSFNTDKNIWENDIVTDIIQKNIVESINVIKTRAGEIKLTDEHKVYKLTLKDFHPVHGYRKEIEMVKVKDLSEDDFLIQPTNLSIENTSIPTIDLMEIVPSILEKYEGGLTLQEKNGFIWLGGDSDKYKGNKIPRHIDSSSFIKVMAWYIAEGWSQKEPYKVKGSLSRYSATFSQSLKANLEKVELIKLALEEGNIPVKYEFSKHLHNQIPKEVTFYFSNITSILLKEAGSHSYIKKIPEWLMGILISDSNLREEFLYTIGLGDGFNTETLYKGFCSTSEVLISQMVTLIQLSGYHFSLQKKNKSQKTQYINYCKKGQKQALVSVGDAKFTEILSISKEEYNDHVFDITVEKNHNFLAGEYGSLLISNSIYPDCRPESRDALAEAFRISNWGSEKVEYYTPYLDGDKYSILEGAVINCSTLSVDFNTILSNTNTCYNPNEKGESCGKCGSCTERLEAFERLGIEDPVKYAR